MDYDLEVVVSLPDGDDREEVELEGAELAKVVDADLVEFEKFMMERVDDSGPLSGPEKSIIKTYIWWKTHPIEEAEDGETPDDRSEM